MYFIVDLICDPSEQPILRLQELASRFRVQTDRRPTPEESTSGKEISDQSSSFEIDPGHVLDRPRHSADFFPVAMPCVVGDESSPQQHEPIVHTELKLTQIAGHAKPSRIANA